MERLGHLLRPSSDPPTDTRVGPRETAAAEKTLPLLFPLRSAARVLIRGFITSC